MSIQLTQEQILKQYEYAMTYVESINKSKPSEISDIEWDNITKLNKEFLLTVLAQDFWSSENLEPFINATK